MTPATPATLQKLGDSLMTRLMPDATRVLFFTGKGGVGKTSLACAVAVDLADRGKRVLLVSTDPASNLGQVFGMEIGDHEPTPVRDVPRLFVLDINPEAAAQAYRDRIIGPIRNSFPPETVKKMEEQLSGACTTEIAAFDEFTELLTGGAPTIGFDHVIFDTAPTGHTLRLLQLPSAWSDFLENNPAGASCLGPLAGLEKQRQRYAQAVSGLGNAEQTTLVLVARPQPSALAEAARTSIELASLGIANQRLILNGVMSDTGSSDPLAQAWISRERHAMARMPDSLAGLPTTRVALQPRNLVGVEALRALLHPASTLGTAAPRPEKSTPLELPPLARLIDQLEAEGQGLVMVLGKGGVGKTTVAAAIAVELAARGHEVHLTTTDPAAHLSMTVESNVSGLQLSRIDPRVETERYRQHVLETKGKKLDHAGRALLEEDLRSPCTEEVAIFQAFYRVIRESSGKFVVVDTAPTGHTLLLLDTMGSFHRELYRHLEPGTHAVTPMMLLQVPKRTKMIIVTLAEPTPVLEAEALQADLRRAGIEPWGWVINASLAAAKPSDPLLAARAALEHAQIERVQRSVQRVVIIPWLMQDPVGSDQLRALNFASSKLVEV
jgi:arsenite-transporting ATPase